MAEAPSPFLTGKLFTMVWLCACASIKMYTYVQGGEVVNYFVCVDSFLKEEEVTDTLR